MITSTEEQLEALNEYWNKLSPELQESIKDFIRENKSKDYLEGSATVAKYILDSIGKGSDPISTAHSCLITALLALNYKDLNLLKEHQWIN